VKRRGFLQAIAGAMAAVFAPAVVSKMAEREDDMLLSEEALEDAWIDVPSQSGQVIFVNSNTEVLAYTGSRDKPFINLSVLPESAWLAPS